ncbi:MAG: SDR family NAD(P)-dependent oxidoreductase, partial [SAR324 cluster bacterium]|nr:SDR family NAD(P)-dependent oxidoreductase [SAR324 cluster bacterium]
MDIKSKRVLVTGSEGFIGSHLVEELLRRGAKLKAFVYYNSFGSAGWLDTLPREKRDAIEIFPGDVRDPHQVMEACKDIDVIFHLAALIGIPYSYKAPESYVATNVSGTLNILQAARHYGIERVMHTSTSETYGSAQFVPITEEHPISAQSPYAASKAAADQLALSFYRSFGTPVTIARPFNAFGPRHSTRAIIPTIITQAASGNKKINLGSLSPTRDFTYVKDTAKGMVAVCESDAVVGDVVNLGSNREISIASLVKVIGTEMGKDLETNSDNERIRPDK